jgi:UDP-N-acetylglucosamine/UDP-N-acetylgalactosamine diphosphorylase
MRSRTFDHSYYAENLPRWAQPHLLRFWPRLDAPRRQALLDDLNQIDFPALPPLIDAFVRNASAFTPPGALEPPAPFPATPPPERAAEYEQARRLGREAIAAGQVAAFTVAGGQGTRLGYDGPKGGFAISPVRNACLFQLFAEQLLGVERRYGRRPLWLIMTSPSNHAETIRIFAQAAYFGLSPADVRFFTQGQMPAFAPDGRILLAEPHRVALAPDGHGGSLRALRASGSLDALREAGAEHISYFQVDNPLVQAIDPLFIGLHLRTGSEMSSKAVTKADDLERVGNFCLADGKLAVIEYSDLPERLARQKNADGSRRFDAGSIAVHVLSRAFVERVTAPGAAATLPWHRAEKKVATVDESGAPLEPDRPNAVKLEMFVFDAIPLAANPIVLYTPREEEFSPVKNADGADSPATSRRDMTRRAARWLAACGVRVPADAGGDPTNAVEISPRFALDAEDLRARLTAPMEIDGRRPLLLG